MKVVKKFWDSEKEMCDLKETVYCQLLGINRRKVIFHLLIKGSLEYSQGRRMLGLNKFAPLLDEKEVFSTNSQNCVSVCYARGFVVEAVFLVKNWTKDLFRKKSGFN